MAELGGHDIRAARRDLEVEAAEILLDPAGENDGEERPGVLVRVRAIAAPFVVDDDEAVDRQHGRRVAYRSHLLFRRPIRAMCWSRSSRGCSNRATRAASVLSSSMQARLGRVQDGRQVAT